jgi:hypothetical protein
MDLDLLIVSQEGVTWHDWCTLADACERSAVPTRPDETRSECPGNRVYRNPGLEGRLIPERCVVSSNIVSRGSDRNRIRSLGLRALVSHTTVFLTS